MSPRGPLRRQNPASATGLQEQVLPANQTNAGGGTRTRTGIALRCLRPLRLPFRHSGDHPPTRVASRLTAGGHSYLSMRQRAPDHFGGRGATPPVPTSPAIPTVRKALGVSRREIVATRTLAPIASSQGPSRAHTRSLHHISSTGGRNSAQIRCATHVDLVSEETVSAPTETSSTVLPPIASESNAASDSPVIARAVDSASRTAPGFVVSPGCAAAPGPSRHSCSTDLVDRSVAQPPGHHGEQRGPVGVQTGRRSPVLPAPRFPHRDGFGGTAPLPRRPGAACTMT